MVDAITQSWTGCMKWSSLGVRQRPHCLGIAIKYEWCQYEWTEVMQRWPRPEWVYKLVIYPGDWTKTALLKNCDQK